MGIRLQKFLADNGVASRRKSEELIAQGLVTVNGATVTEMGFKVDPEKDSVRVRDEPIVPQSDSDYIYIMLHKPTGCVSAVTDQFGRETVIDVLDPKVEARIFPVGRLDYNTTGLLLLTNDGDLTFKLTHPKHGIKKIYMARVCGEPTEQSLEKLRQGVLIDGVKTTPAEAEIVKRDEKTCTLKITITEGRNRQVRKMCEAIGHPVASLKRIATGKIFLGDLPKGCYRYLTEDEVRYLKSIQ